MKIRLVGAEMFHVEMDMTKITVVFFFEILLTYLESACNSVTMLSVF